MRPINTEEIAQVTGGKVLYNQKPTKVKSVCINSREAKEGALFVAIKGSRVDGHDYILDAIKRGAVAVLVEKEVEPVGDAVLILVKDNYAALQALTRYYRKKLEIPIIALTGSSGKTTTKDIIYSVLRQKYKVHRTMGNQNNDLGVPLTIFGIEEDTEIALVEMGMDHLGEISHLVHMAYPDISIITNIGVTHMENLKNQDNIFKAKCEIFETLTKDQMAIVNGDDPYLSTVKGEPFRVVQIGLNKKDFPLFAQNIKSDSSGLEFTVCYNGEYKKIQFKFPGIHNVYNCLFGIYVGLHFNLTFDEIQKGLMEYFPSNNRMDIRNIKGVKAINDTYNANPDAMKAALGVLMDFKEDKGRAFAVIGDMFEIGEKSRTYHLEIGSFIAKSNKIDYLVAVGSLAKDYYNGALKNGMDPDFVYYFENKAQAAQFLQKNIKSEDVLLLKGSRGMFMEEILETLERSSF